MAGAARAGEVEGKEGRRGREESELEALVAERAAAAVEEGRTLERFSMRFLPMPLVTLRG